MTSSWETITACGGNRQRLQRITWPYDKYPDMPQLTAGARITLLDTVGPGVVTNLHVSNYEYLDDVLESSSAREPDAASRLLIEITYDHHAVADIAMPLFDFLGDVDAACDFYSTCYFSKVRLSHNFRLPIPFRQAIRIDIVNPTKTDLIGYADLQWEALDALPKGCGYLSVDYRRGCANLPEEIVTLCDIQAKGSIVAHWFSICSDLPFAKEGQYVCEGNQEFYLDYETEPSLEYLGTEDVYGYSWGFLGSASDGYSAIIRYDTDQQGVATISMLRCRTLDRIPFERACKVSLDYTQEFFSKLSKNPLHQTGVFRDRLGASFAAEYSSCFYYYRA